MVAALLVMALAAPALAGRPADAPGQGKGRSFRDVRGHWAERQIGRLAELGVVRGLEEERFGPDAKLSRAEVAVLWSRALGIDDEAEGDGPKWKGAFLDEDKLPKWARNHIRVSYNARLMLGEATGSGKVFNPNRPVTRQEFVLLMARAVDSAAGNTAMVDAAQALAAQAGTELRERFRDFSAIGPWAYGYILLALREGWVSGYDNGTFRPNQPVSRAEACVLLERLEPEIGHRWGDQVGGVISALGEASITVIPHPDDCDDDDDDDDGEPQPGQPAGPVTYQVGPETRYSICGQGIGFADLAVGMKVKLYLRDDLVGYVKVQAEDDEDELEFEGTIVSVVVSPEGTSITVDPDDPEDDDAAPIPPATYRLASTVVVREDGETVALTAAEHAGRRAEFKVVYGMVLRISLEETD